MTAMLGPTREQKDFFESAFYALKEQEAATLRWAAAYQILATKYVELARRYEALVAHFDTQHGTPCEQIRHQQEVAFLEAAIARLKGQHETSRDRATVGTVTPSSEAGGISDSRFHNPSTLHIENDQVIHEADPGRA